METKTVTVTETAKLIRKTLAAKFPGIKFGVRTSKYSMGSSITVVWTDGPSKNAVDAAVAIYIGSTFDGQTDSKDIVKQHFTDADGETEIVHYGADHVFTNRSYSDTLFNRCLGHIVSRFRLTTRDPETFIDASGTFLSTLVRQTLGGSDLRNGYHGIVRDVDSRSGFKAI